MLRLYSVARQSRDFNVLVQKRFFERVSARAAIQAHSENKGIFIDLRAPSLLNLFGPTGFINIPHYELQEKYRTLDRLDAVYLLDTGGYYSEKAAVFLESNKFRDVRVIEGGVLLWAFDGGPLESQNPEIKDKLEQQKNDYATVKEIAEKNNIKVDLSNHIYPLIDRFFENEEEKKEALAESARNKK